MLHRLLLFFFTKWQILQTVNKMYYEKMMDFLLEEYNDTSLYIVLTTHIADDEREERVKVRNKIASEVAGKYNLPVIDLYDVSLENKHLLSSDGVHFTAEGYDALADKILKELKFNA